MYKNLIAGILFGAAVTFFMGCFTGLIMGVFVIILIEIISLLGGNFVVDHPIYRVLGMLIGIVISISVLSDEFYVKIPMLESKVFIHVDSNRGILLDEKSNIEMVSDGN